MSRGSGNARSALLPARLPSIGNRHSACGCKQCILQGVFDTFWAGQGRLAPDAGVDWGRGLGGLMVSGFAGFRGPGWPNGPPSPRLAPGGFYGKGDWLRAKRGACTLFQTEDTQNMGPRGVGMCQACGARQATSLPPRSRSKPGQGWPALRQAAVQLC